MFHGGMPRAKAEKSLRVRLARRRQCGHICVATLITGAVSDIWPDETLVNFEWPRPGLPLNYLNR